jgi:hypothetical protein
MEKKPTADETIKIALDIRNRYGYVIEWAGKKHTPFRPQKKQR